ncbi:hypothetical protein C6Y40_12235 [Alteromonas alba]|uniref:Uncharacterized protein n=1 Tax=Alteromonas alba TaxID=2079529 RepID=A0A2S9VA49_9ALTE|nr:hypothetical protein [Alteromonas alba]PRO73294.1 hypothetical protein C6Y40_12235 [Alteromonas alba]|tara:strand:+ start:1388 stop:1771 length:384 start_codon:yes stop_codon:yes gene_type:complete
MNLKDARDNYYAFTASLSTTNRQLALAGIAVVWIFAQKYEAGFSLNEELVNPLSTFVLSLGFDLFHYIYASIAWGVFHRLKEQESNITAESDFRAHRAINWPTNIFFWSKVACTAIGYVLLLDFLLF